MFWPKPVYAHPEVPFEFTMVAYDEEHDRLRYSLREAPDGMTIDANGTLRWTPDTSAGAHEFTVEVDDGRGNPVAVPVTLTVDASRFLFVAPDGSDDADGTIGSPLRDVEAAMRGVVARGPGSTLYVRGGTYDIHWQWEQSGVASPFRGATGSPDAPFVVRGYPGETPVLDCGGDGHGLWSYGGSYILMADMEVQSASGRGGALIDGDHNVMQNITVRDSNWPAAANCTGFLVRGAEAVCHRCRGYDNYDRTSTHWNSSNFLVYADGSTERDMYILDSYSENSIVGFKIKHAGVGRLVLHGSREADSSDGWGGIDDGSTIRFNTFERNSTGIAVGISDPNESTAGDILVEYNTVVDANYAFHLQDGYAASTGVTFQHNVLSVAGEPGAGEGDPHFTWVWPWRDAPPDDLVSGGQSCYLGTRSDQGFRFGRTSMGFSDWQSGSRDADSLFSDPTFSMDGYALEAGSTCASFGRVGAWE